MAQDGRRRLTAPRYAREPGARGTASDGNGGQYVGNSPRRMDLDSFDGLVDRTQSGCTCRHLKPPKSWCLRFSCSLTRRMVMRDFFAHVLQRDTKKDLELGEKFTNRWIM